jgi:hypothetical protein
MFFSYLCIVLYRKYGRKYGAFRISIIPRIPLLKIPLASSNWNEFFGNLEAEKIIYSLLKFKLYDTKKIIQEE